MVNLDDRIEALARASEQQRYSIEAFRVNIESLHDSTSELHAGMAELREIVDANSRAIQQNSEHIHALVRIVEIHERRLSALEGGEA